MGVIFNIIKMFITMKSIVCCVVLVGAVTCLPADYEGCAGKLQQNPNLLADLMEGDKEAGCNIIRSVDSSIGTQEECLKIIRKYYGTSSYTEIPQFIEEVHVGMGPEEACKMIHQLIWLQKGLLSLNVGRRWTDFIA